MRLDADGISSFKVFGDAGPPRSPTFCVFEYVYFARPDSVLEGQLVHSVRTRLGAALAREAPVIGGADIVSGVPDSSIAAAIGYSTVTGIPFSEVRARVHVTRRMNAPSLVCAKGHSAHSIAVVWCRLGRRYCARTATSHGHSLSQTTRCARTRSR